jgi:hypothetical protein
MIIFKELLIIQMLTAMIRKLSYPNQNLSGGKKEFEFLHADRRCSKMNGKKLEYPSKDKAEG